MAQICEWASAVMQLIHFGDSLLYVRANSYRASTTEETMTRQSQCFIAYAKIKNESQCTLLIDFFFKNILEVLVCLELANITYVLPISISPKSQSRYIINLS